MIKQARQIFLQRDRAHVAGAIEPLVDERDREDPVLRFGQSILGGSVIQGFRLQVDQRRDEGRGCWRPGD